MGTTMGRMSLASPSVAMARSGCSSLASLWRVTHQSESGLDQSPSTLILSCGCLFTGKFIHTCWLSTRTLASAAASCSAPSTAPNVPFPVRGLYWK